MLWWNLILDIFEKASVHNLSQVVAWAHTDSACLLANVTYRYHIDECGFSGVLKSHQCQLHLLLPKEGPEPVQQPVYEGQHLG